MEELLKEIVDIYEVTKNYKKILKNRDTLQISNKEILHGINNLCLKWFEFERRIEEQCGSDITIKYNTYFEKLLKLSQNTNRRNSFIVCFESILSNYNIDIIVKIKRNCSCNNYSEFNNIFTKIENTEEDEYLKEAIKCANNNCLKASIVLGWCAAIDKIHKVIEKNGFDAFNNKALEMSNQTKGRFKNFNQKPNVHSISELREIFDTNILWVIEGLGLIDINQHARLRSCFEMRCHAGHPGEAPITVYNVMSFFSDINEIIFKSEVFRI